MISVATWNVLHRIHAERFGEAVVSAWPREAERIVAITERVLGLDADVVALQEVSGDQLASLRSRLRAHTLFCFRYPRVPSPLGGRSPLDDPSEHLVTLVRGGDARTLTGEASDDDRGKGLLAIDVSGVCVVNTHVSWGKRRARQLARLGAVVCAAPGCAIVLGDFNADRAVVGPALGDELVFARPDEPALPTRPRPGSSADASNAQENRGETIDHVLVRGGVPVESRVLDSAGLSDHNVVVASIRAG